MTIRGRSATARTPGSTSSRCIPTRQASQRCECSSHRPFDPVPLPLLSQHHSTALPSPKRYDKRYEEEGFKDSRTAIRCTSKLRHCGHRLHQRHLHPWLQPLLAQHGADSQPCAKANVYRREGLCARGSRRTGRGIGSDQRHFHQRLRPLPRPDTGTEGEAPGMCTSGIRCVWDIPITGFYHCF